MVKTNVQVDGDCGQSMSKQAVGHGPVQKRADDPSVKHPRITGEHRLTGKASFDGAVG